MTVLVRYEQARAALAECRSVDEIKDIRDKAEAMAAYARQAKDTELIQWATEIKVRAERKAGEMLVQAKQDGKMADSSTGGRRGMASRWDKALTDGSAYKPTLADIGISEHQSSRWQQLASMTEDHFEAAVATAKDTAGQVTTAFMLREAKKARPSKSPATARKKRRRTAKRSTISQDAAAASSAGVSMLIAYLNRALEIMRSANSFTAQEFDAMHTVASEISTIISRSAK